MASRRSLLQTTLLLAGGWGGSLAAQTAYPQKPIKFIVPFAAGGSADTVARLLSERLGLALGQSVIVDNRGGNGSVLGTDIAAKAAPDGYTVLLSNGAAMTTGPLMGQITQYKPLSDFVHLNLFGTFTNAMIVRADHPAKNVQDLLNMIRLQPGKINYGSAGVGSAGNLTGELLKQLAKVQMVHIPYKGPAPAAQDVLANQVPCGLLAGPTVLPHIRSGKLVALAVSGQARSPTLPDIPTISEAGVKGYDADFSLVMWAPRQVPDELIQKFRQALLDGLKLPESVERLKATDQVVIGSTSEETATRIAKDNAKWGAVTKKIGLSLE